MFEIVGRDPGQTVVLENRLGARGTQAAIFLINQAKPDGYTLGHHHLSILRHPFLTKQPTWDPINDYTYIMQVRASPPAPPSAATAPTEPSTT